MPTTDLIIDGPEGLTAEWLNRVLPASGIDAVVADVSVEPVGTGQMASCVRAELTYARGEGPARLIAKLPAPSADVRERAATTYRTEVGFYRDLAADLGIDVPRCHLAAVSDDGTSFTLLLQDMSPAVAGDQLAGCGADEASLAALAVAGLHGSTWCDTTAAAHDWLIPPMSSMAELIQPAIGDIVAGFLGRRRDLTPEAVAVLGRFAEGFSDWVTARAGRWSLVHNDFRLDNLLLAPPGSGLAPVTTVDWQSLSTGQPLRDVAFLLGTGLAPATRSAHERDIVAAYHARLEELGVEGYDPDVCWDDYRHGLLQGPMICVLGEAVAEITPRGLTMFSVMMNRSAAAIVEHDSFGTF